MEQKDFFLSQPEYCVDASTLIQLRQFYPAEIFPELHDFIFKVLTSGKIVILDLVLEELKKHESGLYKLIVDSLPKDRLLHFDKYLISTQKLILDYYDGKGKSHKLKADPHIISCAIEEKLKVISEEFGSEITKIPYVCDQVNVKHMNFLDLLKELKFKSS